MYESWYGFREKPFNLTPDPKYLYLSAKHAEAIAHLEFGRRERGGFILITGEVGTGKTTLARYFLAKLGAETRTAVVLYPALTAAELLQTILEELRVRTEGQSLKSLIDALHRFLLESRAAGHNVVLLIDEAQDLSAEVLEQIRLISNLETDTEKLIQIILIGQSELRALLGRHELRQLAQRITARYHLTPLDLADTAEYVRHRLTVAGGAGKLAFTSDALRQVHRLSGGIPRLVNLVCDRALLAGFVRSARTITTAMVREAATEVAAQPPGRRSRWRHAVAAGLLAVGLVALAFVLAPRLAHAPGEPALTQSRSKASGPLDSKAASSGAKPLPAQYEDEARPGRTDPPGSSPVPAKPAAEPPVLNGSIDRFVRVAGHESSLVDANERVVRAWGLQPLARTTLRTHLEQLRAVDLPAVLELFHPSRRDTCFVALLRLTDQAALVGAGREPAEILSLAQLSELWTHQAILSWPEEGSLSRDEVRLVQWARPRLAAQGFTDEDLSAAVRRFQASAHLVRDGVLGPRTRMVLFARTPGTRPRLSEGEGRL